MESARQRYRSASKKEKGRILDELAEVAGCHRKSAVRMLRRRSPAAQDRTPATQDRTPAAQGSTPATHDQIPAAQDRTPAAQGGSGQAGSVRGPVYKGDVVEVLRMAWEATDHLCSKRLQPFLPELVPVLRRCGGHPISPEVADRLCRMSPATIDRLLRRWRRWAGRNRFSVAMPVTLLEDTIPVRTFAEWDESRPGFLEVHLVDHCGAGGGGQCLTSLCATDVATGWSEFAPVLVNSRKRTREAIDRLRHLLPVPLLGLDSDFISRNLLDYCVSQQITFVRSRLRREDDLWRVQKKDWSIVRRVIGHDRYSWWEAVDAMEQVYDTLRLYVNFFQPTMKPAGTIGNGSKVRRLYAPARTPYRRLLASGSLSDEVRASLAATWEGLDPILLRRQLDDRVRRLREVADWPEDPFI